MALYLAPAQSTHHCPHLNFEIYVDDEDEDDDDTDDDEEDDEDDFGDYQRPGSVPIVGISALPPMRDQHA